MASVKKYVHAIVEKQIRHNERTTSNYTNIEIDETRQHLNYSLASERGMPMYDYYLKRKSELYVLNRKDVKTMTGWIVTAPQNLKTMEEEKSFFKQPITF